MQPHFFSMGLRCEMKDADDNKSKNTIQHIAKAYSIFQTYLWTMIIIVGGIVLAIKFLL